MWPWLEVKPWNFKVIIFLFLFMFVIKKKTVSRGGRSGGGRDSNKKRKLKDHLFGLEAATL